jgi:tetratricopeptide (TPR) repeat protein
MPLPVKEPSAALFNMLQYITDLGRKFSSTTEMMTGDSDAKNAPVGTTLALLEQGQKVMSMRHLLACEAWTELGELRQADAALARARALGLGEDDFDFLWMRAELDLSWWRLDEARASFEELSRRDPSAAASTRLALLADLRGDDQQAEKELVRAHALDPEGVHLPYRLSSEAFGRIIERALEELRPSTVPPWPTYRSSSIPCRPARWSLPGMKPAFRPSSWGCSSAPAWARRRVASGESCRP